jgi:flagellar biosynthesis protein FliP
MKRFLAMPVATAAFLAGAGPLRAAPPPESILGITLIPGQGGTTLGVPMQIVLLLTLLTLLPAILMSITPFLRMTVVLHFLRQALGTQSTPSNQVLVGLALFLSLIVMQPVATEIYQQSWQPLEQGRIDGAQAWDRAAVPLRTFLLRFAREKDIQLFVQLSHASAPPKPADVPMTTLMPAYVLSELKAAFQIGAVLFLPFLVIDLVVASVTLSIGMVQLPPVMVSAPFKILLFVLVDGWNLVIGSLVRSFY